jgi:hypothetical protein
VGKSNSGVPGTDRILVQPAPNREATDLATKPRRITSRTKSWRLNRDKGKPLWAGSSQASALTCMTISGGKTGRTPCARLILQASQAFFKKTFTPLADDLPRHRETGRDLVVG